MMHWWSDENVRRIIEQGSCAMARRMEEIDSIWESHVEVIDATAHELWDEYELLLDSMYCLVDGMAREARFNELCR